MIVEKRAGFCVIFANFFYIILELATGLFPALLSVIMTTFKEFKKRIRRNSGWRYRLYSIATYPIWKIKAIYWKIRYKK